MIEQTRQGPTAVVTGAAGGMGKAIVNRLSDSGYVIAGLDVNRPGLKELEQAIKTGGGSFLSVECDLMDPVAIARAFEAIDAEIGGLDALVNNAGTCFMGEFPDIAADELNRQMAVNFTGAFHCCQEAVRRMRLRPGVKKIVNISSNGAYNFDVFDPPHYRASKAALDTLTKDLARRYAHDRISVNSIAPAMTETPLFDVLTPEVLETALAAMPHGRAMRPQEVAEWVSFLISPAGDVASGNVIILNQGRDVR